MRVDTPQIDTSMPEDDHRYFGFPFHLVFDAAVYILKRMGFRISYSNIYKGRIIAMKGQMKGSRGGHLDIKLIGRGAVTLTHVRTGSGVVSTRDDTGRLRRQFLWELDEWLHKAKVEELNRVQTSVAKSHGRPNGSYVPPNVAYKLRPYHTHRKRTRPAGLVWVPVGRSSGSAAGHPRVSPPG
jgi:hypothetical protein